MLPTNSVATPRPMPPAKTRKSSALHYSQHAPPPPYAPPFPEVLLNSPNSVTAQLANAATLHDSTEFPDEWIDEKSREELSNLLLKADGIIKTRETELSYTSALCKSLYEDNVALKTKHEVLLARLPTPGMSSPAPSTPTSPRLTSPGPSLSPFAGIMFPASSGESLQLLPPTARLRHTRRISVTPGELAHLSDQNAELLDKLEKLEADSAKADQAGKRKLRKLEQEIQTLRDELDKTQARGAELEEQAKAVAVNAVEVQRRKEEREARVRTLKEKSASLSHSESQGAAVRDFAPPSELPRPSPRSRPYAPSDPSDVSVGPSEESFERSSEEEDIPETDDMSCLSTSPPPAHDRPPQLQLEYAIVSQLMSKIRELEETNTQIKEQQRVTEEQMRAAKWDVDSIRRVYDCLDVADIDIDIEDPEEESEPPSWGRRVPSGDTIKLSSLRRTLVSDMSRFSDIEGSTGFASGISKDMHSTLREDVAGHRGAPGHKARKSVVGLFDPDPAPSGGGGYPPQLQVSPNFRGVPRSSSAADVSSWSTAATDGITPPSPSFSTLQTPLDGPHTGRTLGSELGSEYGDDWPERGFNHHLRASSLYDLAALDLSQSAPASPTQSHAAPPSIVFPPADDAGPSELDGCAPGPCTPPRNPAPQLHVEPPTPTPDKTRPPAATRQFRLSQTMRARTNRWVEGRFADSPRDNVLRKRPSGPGSGSGAKAREARARSASGSGGATLGETFEDAVSQVRRVRNRASLAALGFPVLGSALQARGQADDDAQGEGAEAEVEMEAEAEAEGVADRSLELRRLSQDGGAAVAEPAKRDGVVGLVLEAWLWLQFIVVVMLFLWAMAKRGPKVVLEAERRGAQRGAVDL
ncbi:hypothetical protein BC628DRAFT_1377640 [Trametes gibbosa]|nr:hypothetical protein BC628DRAFT_1377640 [Trametes gibbosa]